MKNEMSVERLNDGLETVKGFCYLGNVLNAMTVSRFSKTRSRWMRFQEYEKVLHFKKVFVRTGKYIRFV